jgi:hypothetical protein
MNRLHAKSFWIGANGTMCIVCLLVAPAISLWWLLLIVGANSGFVAYSSWKSLGDWSPAEIDRDSDGELLIDWSPGKGRMLSMTLSEDGRLSYAFTWDGEQAHGTAQMPPAHVVNSRRKQEPA